MNSQVPTRCVLFVFVSVPILGFRSLGSLGLACGGAGFKGPLESRTWRSARGLGFKGLRVDDLSGFLGWHGSIV